MVGGGGGYGYTAYCPLTLAPTFPTRIGVHIPIVIRELNMDMVYFI